MRPHLDYLPLFHGHSILDRIVRMSNYPFAFGQALQNFCA